MTNLELKGKADSGDFKACKSYAIEMKKKKDYEEAFKYFKKLYDSVLCLFFWMC